MARQLAMNSKMYYNDTDNGGTEAVPVWVELGNATSRNLNMTKDTADVTTFSNNGWRANVATLKDGTVDFEMIWDTTEAGFSFMQARFQDNTQVEMMILDRDKDTNGSEGLHAVFEVGDMSQTGDIADALKASVTLPIGFSSTITPFWQRTYLSSGVDAFTAGDNVYLNGTTGKVSATDTDTFVGLAVYDVAATADAPVYVDTDADEV